MVMVFFILLNYGDFLLTKIGCFRLTLFGDFHLTLTVAADWANVRAYFGEIQADYMTTGEKDLRYQLMQERLFRILTGKQLHF